MGWLPDKQITSITGPAGAVTLSYRISDPGLPVDAPTVLLLSGIPGDTLWVDKYSGTSGAISYANGSYSIADPVYNTGAKGYEIAALLYAAGYRVIEVSYDPLLPPITGICAFGNSRGADPALAFINAYFYAKEAADFVFSGISIANRFAIGHSWGAMSIAMFELPSYHVALNRSVVISPVGMDLYGLANTEHNKVTPLCSVDSALCEYRGGAAGFFKHTTQSDDYNASGPGIFNVLAAASQIFHGTGAATNIRDELKLNPLSVATTLVNNSYYKLLSDDGVRKISGDGHSMMIMRGSHDYAANVIANFWTWRHSIKGLGPALYSVDGGDHNFNGWGDGPSLAAIEFIMTGN